MNSHTVGIRNATDFSPFGVELKGRNFEVSGGENYRFGFNGMEADNDIKGEGNSYTTEFRQYDSRLGRWLSLDPLEYVEADWTPYRFAFNNPITYTDKTGLYETKKEARAAKREARKDGYSTGKTYGEKGSYVFNASNEERYTTFINKYSNHEYTLNQNEVNYYNNFLPKNKQTPVDNYSILGLFMETEYNFSAAGYKTLTSGHDAYMTWERSLPVDQRPSCQGGCTPCDGFWQGFIGFGAGSGTSQVNRVFWSGELNVAGKEATKYALQTGGTTLEMTTSGKILTKLTDVTSFTLTKPLWKQASKSFARGANGKVSVFHNATNGISVNGIWKTEYGILKNKGTEINYINVFE
jgi:RHS repeat-associated protein